MYTVIVPIEKQIMQRSVETIQPGKEEESHVISTDDFKKTWTCLGCNSSFLHHYEIVKHMRLENHLVMVSSDFAPVYEIPQAEIRNMLSGFIA
jgi:hypothetical protein